MKMEERAILGRLIVTMGVYYNRPLNRDVVSLMVNDLADLPLNEVMNGYDEYRRNPKNNHFPLPGAIRAIVEPKTDEDAQAKEAAARIVHAITKYGYVNRNAARGYIGELGWSVVEKQGGWQHLCENAQTDQMGMFQAQARELAKVQIQMAKAGKLNEAPALPQRSNRVLDLATGLARQKQLPTKAEGAK